MGSGVSSGPDLVVSVGFVGSVNGVSRAHRVGQRGVVSFDSQLVRVSLAGLVTRSCSCCMRDPSRVVPTRVLVTRVRGRVNRPLDDADLLVLVVVGVLGVVGIHSVCLGAET